MCDRHVVKFFSCRDCVTLVVPSSVARTLSGTACAAGTSSASGGVCTSCPKGMYSLAGSSSCTQCPAGVYANVSGSSSHSCSGPCDPGRCVAHDCDGFALFVSLTICMKQRWTHVADAVRAFSMVGMAPPPGPPCQHVMGPVSRRAATALLVRMRPWAWLVLQESTQQLLDLLVLRCVHVNRSHWFSFAGDMHVELDFVVHGRGMRRSMEWDQVCFWMHASVHSLLAGPWEWSGAMIM